MKISCRPDFAIPVYSGYLKAKDKDELAPGLHVPAGTPPVFLVHGGDDIISPPEHSVLMHLALKRAGVSAQLQIYAGTAHDFGVRTNERPYSKWTVACADWLRDGGSVKPNGAQLGEDARKRLTEKVERVKEGAQKWADSGRDPSDILRTMEEKFKPLMETGKATEAEAELNRVLEQLKRDAK